MNQPERQQSGLFRDPLKKKRRSTFHLDSAFYARFARLWTAADAMSSSLLHLALAGASGLALGAVGAVGAVSFTRSKSSRDSNGATPAQSSAVGTAGPPLEQRQQAAHPSQVFSGALAPSEVRNRVIQGGSIGELFFAA